MRKILKNSLILKKEIKAISEGIDVDKDNEEKLQDEDDSSMQDEYDNEYGNGVTRNDDSQQIITQNEYEKLISQKDETKASHYYKLYRQNLNLASILKRQYILTEKRFRQSRKVGDYKLARQARDQYHRLDNLSNGYLRLYIEARTKGKI